MAKYIDKDIASYETAILLSIGFAVLTLLISIAFISNGWPVTGMAIGGIFGAAIFSSFQGIRSWMQERYYIAAFKAQTRDLFIFSNGVSESFEDDTTAVQRLKFALEMLRRVKNPHGITVWICLFRDAAAFGYKTGNEGKVVQNIRENREGLTVRETRAEYRAFTEKFRAEKEQAELNEKRGNVRSDEWVHKHWFNQEI